MCVFSISLLPSFSKSISMVATKESSMTFEKIITKEINSLNTFSEHFLSFYIYWKTSHSIYSTVESMANYNLHLDFCFLINLCSSKNTKTKRQAPGWEKNIHNTHVWQSTCTKRDKDDHNLIRMQTTQFLKMGKIFEYLTKANIWMTISTLERYTTSLVTREMLIKTIVRHCYMLSRVARTKNHNPCRTSARMWSN